jgi:hypothetical protein
MTTQTPADRPVAQRAAVTRAETKATRSFSKQIVVANLAIMALMAAYGLWSRNPDTAALLAEYGMWSFAGIAMYMTIGYGDHRLSKGAPSLADLLTLVITRGRGLGGGDRGRAG